MKFFLYFILLSLLGYSIFQDIYFATSFGLTLSIVLEIILKSVDSFVFREWALLLYAVNYLLSPAITYQLESEKIAYSMKINADFYFSLAFPGFVLLCIGMFIIPVGIFKPNINKISKLAFGNQVFFLRFTSLGVIAHLAAGFFSSDFAFLLYLISLLRFVGIFALFAMNPRKYRNITILILGLEIYNGFKGGAFHDAIMWLIFFGLFCLYNFKPNLIFRIIGACTLVVFVLLIQAFKADYRERVWQGGESASIELITVVGLEKANSENLVGESNLLGTLNRGNQAWIFASTVDNMDRNNDFQGMNNVNLYLEAALLPRFLAPNKITAGNALLFNRFSGHHIGSTTSMGLGVFADGYIAYGKWGVYVFTFGLGLIFSLTFKLANVLLNAVINFIFTRLYLINITHLHNNLK
jgi:hypothetical protein